MPLFGLRMSPRKQAQTQVRPDFWESTTSSQSGGTGRNSGRPRANITGEVEANPAHLLRPRAYHYEPPPQPSPSLKTVKSSEVDAELPVEGDGGSEEPTRVRSSVSSIRSKGSATSAEQILELRRSLTRKRSEYSDLGCGDIGHKGDDHIRELITLANSHPLFNYLKQQRRIDDLFYSDVDKRCIYERTPIVSGCAAPPLRKVKGKGLWSVRRLVNLDTKGLVGGVLDAFAGLLSFYDGTEGMEDHHRSRGHSHGSGLVSDEQQNGECKMKLRRFAVACQIRVEEQKIRLYVATEDDAPISDEAEVYLQRIWVLLRDLSHSNIREQFFHENDEDDDMDNDTDEKAENEIENERVIPDIPLDQASPFDCPPLVALLDYTMLNSYAHWHPRFVKHFAHVHSARRISPQLFRIFEQIPDGDGQQVQLVWASFISEAESLNAAFESSGRDYVRSHDFRERFFETIACLENVVPGQGTVADILIYEDDKKRKETEVKSSPSRFRRFIARDKKEKDEKTNELPDSKGKGKATVEDEAELVIDPEVEVIRNEPPSICRCSLTRCMRKLVSPFDHITTLIDFATLSHRRALLEFSLEVIPVHVPTEDEDAQDQEEVNNDDAVQGQNGIRPCEGVSDYHDNSRSVRRSLAVFGRRPKSKNPPANAHRTPPTRNSLQSLMLKSFFSNLMSRYEPGSTREKIAELASEIVPPRLLPPRRIHPEIKLLYFLTSSRIPTARHIGVSSPSCIPCTVLFSIWNELHGQSFHVSGVSIVTNNHDLGESLDLDSKSRFGGKKTEIGNGKYSSSWTLPKEWRGTELVMRVEEELRVRIGEALLREVDLRRMIKGDDGWWEAGKDGQPKPDARFVIHAGTSKPHGSDSQGDKDGGRRRYDIKKSKRTWPSRVRNAKWSFMDPSSACQSQ
ncbi:hypothetical protein KEM54_005268 [Ascosphaera aggregata]|nr:hypothetical protein KEM54_005268 [Ascosphaera aggregata]